MSFCTGVLHVCLNLKSCQNRVFSHIRWHQYKAVNLNGRSSARWCGSTLVRFCCLLLQGHNGIHDAARDWRCGHYCSEDSKDTQAAHGKRTCWLGCHQHIHRSYFMLFVLQGRTSSDAFCLNQGPLRRPLYYIASVLTLGLTECRQLYHRHPLPHLHRLQAQGEC